MAAVVPENSCYLHRDLVLGAIDGPNDFCTRRLAAGGTLDPSERLDYAQFRKWVASLAVPGMVARSASFNRLSPIGDVTRVQPVLDAALRAGMETCWRRDCDIDDDLIGWVNGLWDRIAHFVLVAGDGDYAPMCLDLLEDGAAVTIIGVPWYLSAELHRVSHHPRGRVLNYDDVPGLCTYAIGSASITDVPMEGTMWFSPHRSEP